MKTQYTPGPMDTVRHYRELLERALFALQDMQAMPSLRVELSGALAQDPDDIEKALVQRTELMEACKALAQLGIEKCERCEGTGQRQGGAINEACGQCGGTGEITFNPHPDDIRAARAAIAKVEGRGE